MRDRGAKVGPGDFAENITISGFDLRLVRVGMRISIGEALLEVTQIGKECHQHCEIYRQVGDCVMPREGVFARVLVGGRIRPGDAIREEVGSAPDALAPGCEGDDRR
jgi:MOSC domain-containing protein YiiM